MRTWIRLAHTSPSKVNAAQGTIVVIVPDADDWHLTPELGISSVRLLQSEPNQRYIEQKLISLSHCRLTIERGVRVCSRVLLLEHLGRCGAEELERRDV